MTVRRTKCQQGFGISSTNALVKTWSLTQSVSEQACSWASTGCESATASPKNRKGCDIGYALAVSSCEEANNVDACTVTALDAITAFAVPNPNCSSQSQSVFSGLVALRVAPVSRSLSLLRTGKVLIKPTLSAVDVCQLKQLLQRCQCFFSSLIEISVDANVENKSESRYSRSSR